MRVLCADVRLAGKPHHDWKEGYELMYAFQALGIQCDIAGPNGLQYTELDIPRIAPLYTLIIVTENYPFARTDVAPYGWKWWNWGQISTPTLFWAIDTHVQDYREFIRRANFTYVAFTNRQHWIDYKLAKSFVMQYALSTVHQKLSEVYPKQYDCIFIGSLSVSPRRKYLCDTFGIQHMEAYGLEYFRTMKKAKICFNNSISTDINAKYFEIMGSGSFLLTNYSQDLVDYVHEDVRDDLKACMYRTDPEIGEKIAYYLTHEEEREAIAKRLHDYVWANHTWQSRCKEILQFINTQP